MEQMTTLRLALSRELDIPSATAGKHDRKGLGGGGLVPVGTCYFLCLTKEMVTEEWLNKCIPTSQGL